MSAVYDRRLAEGRGDEMCSIAMSSARAATSSASSHCCAEAVRAVDLVAAQAGISAGSPDCALERCARDVRIVPQHVTVAPSAILDAGRALLGLDPTSFVF